MLKIDYLKPERKIARRLRRLQRYAGKHSFTIAFSEFSRMARDFERFDTGDDIEEQLAQAAAEIKED